MPRLTPPTFLDLGHGQTVTRHLFTRRGLPFIGALLLAALLATLLWPGTGPADAQSDTEKPAKPTGFQIATQQGSLDVGLDWDGVDGADNYLVRWRSVDKGEALNTGVETEATSATITVADYGSWVVRVQACNDAGCGKPNNKQFRVEPAPEPVPARPAALQISAAPGSLDMALNWDDTPNADWHQVRWRLAAPDQPLNQGIETHSSDAAITVASYGRWVVRVVGCNSGGCGPGATQTVDVIPAQPANLAVSATPGELQVSATWDAVAGASSYSVHWRPGDGGLDVANQVTVSATSAAFTAPGYGEWVVQVRACDDGVCGLGTAQSVDVLPPQPSNLAVSATLGELNLPATWDAVAGASSYSVRWRRSDGGFEAGNEVIATANSAAITVSGYGRWVVQVRACDAGVCGLGTAQSAVVRPGEAANLAVSATPGQLGVSVSWDHVEGATGYLLNWRRPDGVIASGNSLDTADTNATIAMSDYGRWVVRVTACGGATCGMGVARLVDVLPAQPSNLAVSAGPGDLDASATWDAAAGATSYKVRWRQVAGGFEEGNETTVAVTSANFIVADYGSWVVRVEGCNGGVCGLGIAQMVTITSPPASPPSQDPLPATPKSSAGGYRGQLGDVMVEFSRRRHQQEPESRRPVRGNGSGVQGEQTTTTSIVYVIDDSASMDGDFPEVRTALGDVRDETMANTKVALILFGTKPTTLFGLTDHSSAPWNTHINTPGGKLGSTNYESPLQNAKALLDADSADNKKVIFFTDAQRPYPTAEVEAFKNAGIIVDTISFGDHYSEMFSSMEKIAMETSGAYRNVAKPSQGTTNTPAVTPEAMSAILKDAVADNTATLFLIDQSFSVYPMANSKRATPDNSIFNLPLAAAATKAGSGTGRQVGLARFLGETTADEQWPQLVNHLATYKVVDSVGSSSLSMPDGSFLAYGSTDIDQALSEAFTTVSAATATSKRVVLITDGISAKDVQTATLNKYKNDSNVTLDVVAWGAHADRVQLKTWAAAASGTFSVALVRPQAPSGLTATPGDAQVVLSWTDPSNSEINKYQLRQQEAGGVWSAWTDIPSSSASTTTHTVTGLTNDQLYAFGIRAVRGTDTIGQASTVSATPSSD